MISVSSPSWWGSNSSRVRWQSRSQNVWKWYDFVVVLNEQIMRPVSMGRRQMSRQFTVDSRRRLVARWGGIRGDPVAAVRMHRCRWRRRWTSGWRGGSHGTQSRSTGYLSAVHALVMSALWQVPRPICNSARDKRNKMAVSSCRTVVTWPS